MPHDTVVFADAVADEFAKKSMKLIHPASVLKIGDAPGSARGKTENVHQLVIDALSGRNIRSNEQNENSSMFKNFYPFKYNFLTFLCSFTTHGYCYS